MSNVINLNKARKKKARLEKEKSAEENRAKHGQTKIEKLFSKTVKDKQQQNVDDHKIDEE